MWHFLYVLAFLCIGHIDAKLSPYKARHIHSLCSDVREGRQLITRRAESSFYQEILLGGLLLDGDPFCYPSPYSILHTHARQQFLVTAEELKASGLTGMARITKCAFQVNASLPDMLSARLVPQRLEIKLAQMSGIPEKKQLVKGMSSVYVEHHYIPHEGWNEHKLRRSFCWDGKSNLIFEILTYADLPGESIPVTLVDLGKNVSWISWMEPCERVNTSLNKRPFLKLTIEQI